MADEVGNDVRLIIKQEVGPILDRLTRMETKMDEQKEVAKESSFGPRIAKLEQTIAKMDGHIIGLGAGAGIIISLVFKLIGN